MNTQQTMRIIGASLSLLASSGCFEHQNPATKDQDPNRLSAGIITLSQLERFQAEIEHSDMPERAREILQRASADYRSLREFEISMQCWLGPGGPRPLPATDYAKSIGDLADSGKSFYQGAADITVSHSFSMLANYIATPTVSAGPEQGLPLMIPAPHEALRLATTARETLYMQVFQPFLTNSTFAVGR